MKPHNVSRSSHPGHAPAAFAQLLTSFTQTDGAQVFHCTAGKDRTGWTSYLLLRIAGDDAQAIMDDYLLTNEYADASIQDTEPDHRAP